MPKRKAAEKTDRNYDEKKAISGIVEKGKPAIIAHLKFLRERNEFGHLKEAMDYLVTKGVRIRPTDLMDSGS